VETAAEATELCHMEGGELLKEIQDMYLVQMTEDGA